MVVLLDASDRDAPRIDEPALSKLRRLGMTIELLRDEQTFGFVQRGRTNRCITRPCER